jgi:hypothetical protein
MSLPKKNNITSFQLSVSHHQAKSMISSLYFFRDDKKRRLFFNVYLIGIRFANTLIIFKLSIKSSHPITLYYGTMIQY